MEWKTMEGVSPTVFRVGRFRFFFFSREEERPHVHVATPDAVAKFWIEPHVELARSTEMKARDVRRAWTIVEQRRGEILDAWKEFFGTSGDEL